MAARGSLTVVGTGIALGIHLTDEARAAIASADRFFHLAADPLAATWLHGLHAKASNLSTEYRVGEDRIQIYERIVERMLEPVRAGKRVTAAFYGHPGVYVTPSHVAIRRARAEGHDARMLPAISAEDCLYRGPRRRSRLLGLRELRRDGFSAAPAAGRYVEQPHPLADLRDRRRNCGH